MSDDDDVTVYFATNRDIAGSDDEPRFGNRFNEKGPQIFGWAKPSSSKSVGGEANIGFGGPALSRKSILVERR